MTTQHATTPARQARASGRRRTTAASRADRHALYERAVQDAETDVATWAKIYRKIRKKEPNTLREDFCGTANACAQWVKGKKHRRAIGIDLDEPTLAWGREHNIAPLGPEADRVQLIQANVMDAVGPKADLVCAMNFSYYCLKSRDLLGKYFRAARSRLNRDGLFLMDVFGGTEAMDVDENENDFGDFVYRWEQEFFDPLTHEMLCHIHFHFPDGSSISPAFSYDWRMWTIPELYDLLLEVGFSKVHRLWERTDDEGEGTGSFYEPRRAENQASWWTYLVAQP